MLTQLRRALVFSVVLVVICFAYAGVETAVGQVFFSSQANGSLVKLNGTIIGSSLAGQSWKGPKWFQGRDDSDNPSATGATNYGPRSTQLYQQVRAEIAALRSEGIDPTSGLVTGSGSGIDPDIAPADAYAQVDAVARANKLPVSAVKSLVASDVVGYDFGFLGSPYVNVLSLNMALAKVTHVLTP